MSGPDSAVILVPPSGGGHPRETPAQLRGTVDALGRRMVRRVAWFLSIPTALALLTAIVAGPGCSATDDTASGDDGGDDGGSCVGPAPRCTYRPSNSCHQVEEDEFCQGGRWVCPHSDPQVCTDCSGAAHLFVCNDENDSYHCPLRQTACPKDASVDADAGDGGDAKSDAEANDSGDATPD